MNTRYALPVACALAVHASLLFGFRHAAHVPTSPAEPATKLLEKVIKLNPIVEIPETTESNSAAKGNPEPDIARNPEPKTEITTDRPPIEISVPPADARRSNHLIFDAGPIGVPDGNPISDGRLGILPASGLDNPPHARIQAAPDYPPSARREGLEGEVTVEFTVDDAGRVSNPMVVRSSHRVFEEPTLRAVLKWRFEPGRRDGRIVRFRMAVPLMFRLNGE